MLTIADFVGKYELHTGMYDQIRLNDYITRYEPLYLMDLFGAKLYDEFQSDLILNVPQSPNFKSIYDPFHENLFCRDLIKSEGVREMLKGFIYFEYVKDLINQITPIGNVRPVGENSEPVSTIYSTMYDRYNEAVKSYRAIQRKIIENFSIKTGQLVLFTLSNAGTGYVDALNVATTTTGTGTGATVNITTDGFGVVTLAELANDGGEKYAIGEILTIAGGANDAQLTVDYVGKGKFCDFMGQNKGFCYWL
jgi:hypothetical protein